VAETGVGDAVVCGHGYRVVGAGGRADVRSGCAVLAVVAARRGNVGRCGGVGRRCHASPSPPPIYKAAMEVRGGDAVVGVHSCRVVCAGGGEDVRGACAVLEAAVVSRGPFEPWARRDFACVCLRFLSARYFVYLPSILRHCSTNFAFCQHMLSLRE